MEFRDSPQQAAFRQVVARFIADHCPQEIRRKPLRGNAVSSGREEVAVVRWRAALAERGWVVPHWPKEYGGAGLTVAEQFVLNEELSRAGAPLPEIFGPGIVGPTLIEHGTEAQKREHLPGISTARVRWCQGYSEPSSGSDLASLQTRAVRDGDEYVLNGQKIWTTAAHSADWMYMLARTNPDAPKHRGITYLLVNMRSAGITVRPLINLANRHEFNEVFFENVRVPVANRVGEENRGWYVGTTTLDFERSAIGSASGLIEDVRALVKLAGQKSISREVRMAIAERAIEAQVARVLSLHVFDMQKRGLIPNAEASMAKLFGSELHQRVASTAMLITGMNAQAHCYDDVQSADFAASYLSQVATTIAGGTSEIQRNIIAQRGLGLAR